MIFIMKNFILYSFVILAVSCNHKSDPAPAPSNNNGSLKLDTNYNPVDPATAPSVGFFLDDWQPKTFVVPDHVDGIQIYSTPTDTVNIDLNKVVAKVPKYLFGNNANQWMGQIVDQSSLMGYIKDMNPIVIRFPGGSISDMYFWNSPVNTPPADVATTLYNTDLTSRSVSTTDYWYGTNSGSWTISLDNYYALLQQTGSVGMITINYAYARYGKGTTPVQTAAHLAAEWVRYDKGRTKFWEIGNEDDGTWEAGYKINLSDNQDGQPEIISGTVYGQHFNVFADSMRHAALQVGTSIKIGAQVIGSGPSNTVDQEWNSNLFTAIGNAADFFIVHHYYSPYHQNSTSSVILQSAIDETNGITTYLNSSVSQAGAQMKPIALTEYNIESEGSKQKVSAVAGMHAVLTIGEVLSNNFGETSRWDLANSWDTGNDQGLFNNVALSDVEPGASPWNPRPAFFYLYYLQKYLGDRLVSTTLSPAVSDLNAYSSTFTSGEAGTIIVNKGVATHTVLININHFNPGTEFYWYNLVPGIDNGEFSSQVIVNNTNPTGSTGGPLNYASIKAFSVPITSGSFEISVPPRGVVFLVVQKK